ncbi:MAG: sensor histidine kinase [Bacteroidota bacterium]
MSKLKEYLISSKVYVEGTVFLSICLFTILLLIGNVHQFQIVFFFLMMAFNVALLYYIGSIRRDELGRINDAIREIRENKLKTPDQIRLGSDLRPVQDELRELLRKSVSDIETLKKLEHVRTEFLGNVSHELRTPIFAIQGYLETLLDGAIDDSRVNRSFLQKANHHTGNLNNLLNDLIDISMIESGEMRLSMRYFNLFEFLQPVVQEFLPACEEKGLRLMMPPFRDTLQVFGDKNKLRQVFVNLIQNAIKYTETGSIEIIVSEYPKKVRIAVKDTGIGIAPDDQPRIFERFYRVDRDRSRAVGGTGLGLAIVKHIAEAHGTHVEVKSILGRGSEFSFDLKK